MTARRRRRRPSSSAALLSALATSALALLPAASAAAEAMPPRSTEDRKVEAAYEFARAKLLADGGSFEEALAAFQRSIELDGSDPYNLIELSKFYSYLAQISQSESKQVGNLRAAAKAATDARRLAPGNLDALRAFALVHLRLVERNQLDSMAAATSAFEQLRERTEGDLQVLTSLAQLYIWQRNSQKASEVLQEAASTRPGHPMVQTMLVETLLDVGDKAGAEEALGQLVALQPATLEHRLRLAELASERGDHQRAVEVLRGAPESLATSPRLRQLSARELHLIGDNAEALTLTEGLLEEFPNRYGLRRLRVAIFYALARTEDALAEMRPLVAESDAGERNVPDTLFLSRLLERAGRSLEAVDALRALAASSSGDEALQVKMALIALLEREGRTDEAIELLRGEFEQAPEDDSGRFGRMLSQFLVRYDRPQEALEVIDRTLERATGDGELERTRLQRLAVLALREEWEQVVASAPQLLASASAEVKVAVYQQVGEALAHLGRTGEALELLAEGERELESPQLLAERVELLFDADRGAEARALLDRLAASGEINDLLFAAQVHQRGERYDEAITLLDQVVRDHPESTNATFLLGAAYERAGRREPAIATFQDLIARSPGHAPALNYLGYMWAERGENLSQALELIQRAVALDPDNGAYVDSLGWVYYQLGRYEEARQQLEWAARLVPGDPTILEHLGDLYVKLKDVERARNSYQQALDLGGDGIDEVRRKLRTLPEKGL